MLNFEELSRQALEAAESGKYDQYTALCADLIYFGTLLRNQIAKGKSTRKLQRTAEELIPTLEFLEKWDEEAKVAAQLRQIPSVKSVLQKMIVDDAVYIEMALGKITYVAQRMIEDSSVDPESELSDLYEDSKQSWHEVNIRSRNFNHYDRFRVAVPERFQTPYELSTDFYSNL